MTPDIILQRTGIDVRAVEQGDDAWHKLRLGVITASEVHNVIAKPRSGKKWPDMKMSYFHTLLAEVCTGVAPEVNAKALAWGKQYENDARTLFEFTSGVNVTESPIIYCDESMRTACSPDGLCSDGNGLELKCPFTHRINPLRRLIVSQSGILLPRLIRLPCWNYWMHWKQQKSALQNWKRGKYCSRNVAACFIEQIFTMITKR